MSEFNLASFINLVGAQNWASRVRSISSQTASAKRAGKLAAEKFGSETAIEKARQGLALTKAEAAYVNLATRIPELYETLTSTGQNRLRQTMQQCLEANRTLIPLLHLIHTACLQKERGFEVGFPGLNHATPYDLLIKRQDAEAEIACETISAEDGHAVHRGVWSNLIDRIDPDLQTWLAAHPGRYLLKLTLPQGLKPASEEREIPSLQARIHNMLAGASRYDFDEAAVLRLDPLLLAGAQRGTGLQPGGILSTLRREFGPEAHFSVTAAGSSMFIMAARGSAENEVAAALRRRMATIAPTRLSGTRPGILAMMIDDTDQLEWQSLREQLLLEGETRQFLTRPQAKNIVAVTCVSRFELTSSGAAGGDVRFRNPSHPAAKSPHLAPAVLSTV